MSILINIATVFIGLSLMAIIVFLLVNKKMSESQSVLWFLIGFITIVLGLFPDIIPFVADSLGIWYPPTLSFLIAFLGLLFIVLKITVITSVHENQINELFLELVLSKDENEKLRKELEDMRKEAE